MISFRIKWRRFSGHVLLNVEAGPGSSDAEQLFDKHEGLGFLTMKHSEWDVFRAAMDAAEKAGKLRFLAYENKEPDSRNANRLTNEELQDAAQRLVDECELSLVRPESKRHNYMLDDGQFAEVVQHATEIINGRA